MLATTSTEKGTTTIHCRVTLVGTMMMPGIIIINIIIIIL
jgi:hypothetical protein